MAYSISLTLKLGSGNAGKTLKVLRVDNVVGPVEVPITPTTVYERPATGVYYVVLSLPDNFRGPVVFLNNADDAFLDMFGVDPYEIEGVRLHADGLDRPQIEAGVSAKKALQAVGATTAGEAARDGDDISYAALGNPGTPRVVGTAVDGERTAITIN